MTPAAGGRCVPVELTPAVLAQWPLPAPDADGDKESRGQVLVIAGSREIPGGALLAANSALRAGAGKLVMAAPASVAQGLALAVPESRVIAMPETDDGGFAASGIALLDDCVAQAAAVLIGPGMVDAAATRALTQAVLARCRQSTVVLDALAMEVAREAGFMFSQPVILTPHAGEMAHLIDVDKETVRADPVATAWKAARRWRAVVLLKGATSCIADPDGQVWSHSARTPGLGTSGSGDVLAGVIAGFAARGASPAQAASWGVALHARAGAALQERLGTTGYLARELSAELAPVLKTMAGGHG